MNVLLDSKEGRDRFLRSVNDSVFFELAPCFTPQVNPYYCGIASLSMILNALTSEGFDLSPFQEKNEFLTFTQDNLLNRDTDQSVKKRSVILKQEKPSGDDLESDSFDPGISLVDMGKLVSFYHLDFVLHRLGQFQDKCVNEFREAVICSLSNKAGYLLCNFYGKALGETTGGHFSCPAVFDEKTDSILMLDVARHKTSWYWVNLVDFVKSMALPHGKRGWIQIRKRK